MTTLQEILDAAQNLPSSQRVQLVQALWESISPVEWPVPNDAWTLEINRRSDALDAGAMSTSPWPEVRERSRRKAGL